MKIRTRIISLAIAALMLAALAALVVPAAALPVYEPSKGYASGKYYASLSAYAPTGDQRYDTVAIALTQLGYHEGDSDLDFDGMNTSNTTASSARWITVRETASATVTPGAPHLFPSACVRREWRSPPPLPR